MAQKHNEDTEELKITIGGHELTGYTSGEEVNIPLADVEPPTLGSVTDQVDRIQAQVAMCQGYILELEKEIEKFLMGTAVAMPLEKRVELALAAWRIIQDENAMVKAQMETMKEAQEEIVFDLRQNKEMFSSILRRMFGDDWYEWQDKGKMMAEYETDQRNMREDNANLTTELEKYKVENREFLRCNIELMKKYKSFESEVNELKAKGESCPTSGPK